MKKRRKIKRYRVFIYILLVILIPFTISSAYSYFIQPLNVDGVSTIKPPDTVNFCDGTVDYKINSWQNGADSYFYVITFTLTNNGNKNYNNWNVYFEIPDDTEVRSFSSVEVELSGKKLRAKNVHYNSTMQPGQSINFEIQLIMSNPNYEPTNISINDCYVNVDNSEVTENNVRVDFQFTSMTGVITYQYNIAVTNDGTDTITNWTIRMKKPSNAEIVNVWNANYIVTDEYIEFSNMTYNGTLSSGQTANFGMMITTDQYKFSPELYE